MSRAFSIYVSKISRQAPKNQKMITPSASELGVLTGLHEQLVTTRAETERYRHLMHQGIGHIERHHATQALDNIFLTRENEDLRRALTEQREVVGSLTRKVELCFAESQRLSSENQMLLAVLRTKDSEIDELRKKVNAHIQSHKSTYSMLKQVDNERTSVRESETKVKEELRALKCKFSMRHEETWAAQEKNAELNEALVKYLEANAQLKAEIKKLKGATHLVCGPGDKECSRLHCLENKQLLAKMQEKFKRALQRHPNLSRELDLTAEVSLVGSHKTLMHPTKVVVKPMSPQAKVIIVNRHVTPLFPRTENAVVTHLPPLRNVTDNAIHATQ